MKIYTEEQVIRMIEKSRQTGLTAEYLILTTTPIELPSDEEIRNSLERSLNNYNVNDAAKEVWIDGAKWMRDKIKGGEK